MAFLITSAALGAIVGHARAEHPREACGLLVGVAGVERGSGAVAGTRPAPNVAADPLRGFEIDPATLLRVHREARGAGHVVVGHYHSHPGGDLEPSRTDAARAVEDGQLWLIVAGERVAGWIATADGPLHGRFAKVELAD